MSVAHISPQHQRTAGFSCCGLPPKRPVRPIACAMEPKHGAAEQPAAAEAAIELSRYNHATDAGSSSAGMQHGITHVEAADSAAEAAGTGRSRAQADAGRQQSADAANDISSCSEDAESDEEQADQAMLAALLEQLQDLSVVEGAAAAHQLTTLTAAEELLPSFDLAGVAALISSGKARRIICMVGAGISVSAGIPDFRTPGTGLYSQLERFNLPRPEAVFSMDFFRAQPEPFFMLAKELFPGKYVPTPTHFFMKLLHTKGMLLRCYSQNIDSLECQAGLPPKCVVAAHGNFDGAHCINCRRPYSTSYVEEAVLEGRVCYCNRCGGLVKPDIVFFGENLPARFFTQQSADFPACDLLLVMGTSLVVQPFAGLIDRVPHTTPRALLNRERVGESYETRVIERLLGLSSGRRSRGFDFSHAPGCRDVCVLGNADDSVRELANLLGWREELEDLIAAAHHSSRQTNEGPLQSGLSGSDAAGSSGAGESTSTASATVGGASSEDAVMGGDGDGGAAEEAHKAAAAAAAVGQVVGADPLA